MIRNCIEDCNKILITYRYNGILNKVKTEYENL